MSMHPDQVTLDEQEELDWTTLLDEYDYARPQRGELREGMVMQIEENGILVSIGTKREGVIPAQDLRQIGDEFIAELKVGGSILVYVQEPENRDGDLILSLTMVQVAKDWETAEQLFQDGGITAVR